MKMEAPSIYPNLTRLVRGLRSRVPSTSQVFKAFKKYGEFTTAEATDALGYGSSPEVRVGKLGPNGQHSATVWGNTPDGAGYFTLNVIMIQQFEELRWAAQNYDESLTAWSERAHRRKEWEVLVERAELSIEALVLHECVHWGDGRMTAAHKHNPDKYLHQDGTAVRAGFKDRGHQFVRAAYGSRIGWVKRNGLLIANHELPGWMGTFKREGVWSYYQPLDRSGPAPIRPPALEKLEKIATPMRLR